MPEYGTCRYLRELVAVKHRWRLKVDAAEKQGPDGRCSADCNEHHDHGRRSPADGPLLRPQAGPRHGSSPGRRRDARADGPLPAPSVLRTPELAGVSTQEYADEEGPSSVAADRRRPQRPAAARPGRPRGDPPPDDTIVEVSGDAANGFDDPSTTTARSRFPPTDSEARAECGEYDNRVAGSGAGPRCASGTATSTRDAAWRWTGRTRRDPAPPG